MSLSTLNVPHHRIIRYSKEAFPRFQHTLQRIKDTVKNVKYSFDTDSKTLKWTHEMSDPHIVLCYGTSPPSTCSTELQKIAVVDVPSVEKTKHTLQSLSDCSVPVLLICEIKSNTSGDLTYEDCLLLNGIRALPNELMETVLFAIDRSDDSFNLETVLEISEKIAAELKLNSNDIYHRIFRLFDSNIGIRASLYFEKQLLNRYINKKPELQFTIECMNRFEKELDSQKFFDDYKFFLDENIFHEENSLKFIRDAAIQFFLEGSQTTRYESVVDRVKTELVHYICQKLGNQIAETLIEKFKSDVTAADLNLSDNLTDNIDVSGIRQTFYSFVVSYIPKMILERVTAVITVLKTFIFAENLNSISFRHKIADNVYQQIMANKEGLIWCILTKFKELQMPRLQQIKKSLNDLISLTEGRLESRNETDCFYHELKIIATRINHIAAIGCDGCTFCVYVQNSSVQAPHICKYLSSYLKKASQIVIREYKTTSVEEFANLQSGNKIVRGTLTNQYGSLGFLLKDNHHYYSATCRHVTAGCNANNLHVKLLDGTIIKASEKYEPSLNLDFAVIKLHETPLPVCTGVRNKYDEFVRGQVFMSDEFTLNPETPVYKWGSKTSLTFGQYKETYEKIEHIEDSYPWIIIKNDVDEKENRDFAESGDSGSLVCFSEDGYEVAACLVIGSYSDPGTFACCMISDGLSLIKTAIPDINHLFRKENVETSGFVML